MDYLDLALHLCRTEFAKSLAKHLRPCDDLAPPHLCFSPLSPITLVAASLLRVELEEFGECLCEEDISKLGEELANVAWCSVKT